MQHRTAYAKIIVLNQQEEPIESITGKISSGSVSSDGTSSVRRTCSLSLACDKDENIITDEFWCLKNKFRLEIGEDGNNWYKQGIFVINSFSKNLSVNNLTVSISGQDKMCLLNGSLGGVMPAETNFGTIDIETAEGNILVEKIPIHTIVREALLKYGKESLGNIIIEDLNEVGYELLEWQGDKDVYVYLDASDTSKVINYSIEKDYVKGAVTQFYSLDPTIDNTEATVRFYGNNIKVYTAKVGFGETIGYHQTKFVYPDDLILKVGEPLTNLFDKIKTMLGSYEYFYDENGRFHFQKQQTYTQTLFNPLGGLEIKQPIALASPYGYRFDTDELIISKGITLNTTNVKNDFVVWGTTKDSKLPFHLRYALCQKPTSYFGFSHEWDKASGEDWKEILYAMASDYLANHEKSGFYSEIANRNNFVSVTGKTGYEPFYEDVLEFYDNENKKWKQSYWFEITEAYSNYSIEMIGHRILTENQTSTTALFYNDTPEGVFIYDGETFIQNDTAYTPIQIGPNYDNLFQRSAQGTSAAERLATLFQEHVYLGNNLNLTCVPIYELQPNTRIYVNGVGDCLLTRINFQIGHQANMSLTCSKIGE